MVKVRKIKEAFKKEGFFDFIALTFYLVVYNKVIKPLERGMRWLLRKLLLRKLFAQLAES